MRETENLSRHEQLRLDYLHTNYYYLNEHEKEEYNYLRQKSKGRPDAAQKTPTKQTVQASPEDSKTDSSGCYLNTRVKVLLAEAKRIPALL